jgi:hypothetical protein
MTRRLITLAALLLFSVGAFAADAIDIKANHHSAGELQEKLELEQLLEKYYVSDLEGRDAVVQAAPLQSKAKTA